MDVQSSPGTKKGNEFSVMPSVQHEVNMIEGAFWLYTQRKEHNNSLFWPLKEGPVSTVSCPNLEGNCMESEKVNIMSISPTNHLEYAHLDSNNLCV